MQIVGLLQGDGGKDAGATQARAHGLQLFGIEAGALGIALWLRLMLIALWLALASVMIRRYSRRSSPS